MDKPISAEAREWAIEAIRKHGEYTSLDDLLNRAERLAQHVASGVVTRKEVEYNNANGIKNLLTVRFTSEVDGSRSNG